MYWEVGYDVGDGIFSVNMIEGTKVMAELASQDHAKRHGYRVAYLHQITEAEVKENRAKGMPLLDSFDEYFLT